MAPRPIAALGYKSYRRMWTGALISTIGNMMHVTTVGWVMATLSDSPLKVTAVSFASLLPLFVLSPVSGALADRFPRRTMLAVTTMLQASVALCLSLLSAGGHLGFGVLLVFGVLGGTGGAMSAPVFQAIVPTLVPTPVVRNAVVLNSTQFNIGRAIGPAIGGLLIDATGPTIVFALNGLSFLAVLYGLIGLPSTAVKRTVADRSIVGDITAGVRYVRSMPGLRLAIATVGIAAMSAGSLQFLIPIYARQALDVGATKYGILLSSFGGASILAGFLLLVFDRGIPYRVLVGSALALTSISMIGVGLAPGLLMASFAVGLCGIAHFVNTSSLNSSMQDQLDDRVRGRVMSLWLMTFGGMAPLAVITQGAVAELVGIRAVIVANGVLVAAYLLYVTLTGRLRFLDPTAAVPDGPGEPDNSVESNNATPAPPATAQDNGAPAPGDTDKQDNPGDPMTADSGDHAPVA